MPGVFMEAILDYQESDSTGDEIGKDQAPARRN
jgi:hypothetical protein